MSRFASLRLAAATCATIALAGALTSTPTANAAVAVPRAFSATSYWNTPLPAGAPVDTRSASIIDFLKTDSSHPYIRVIGTESSGGWGEPIFWAKPTDPVYNVIATRYTLPPEFRSLRIPAAARVPATSDAQMTIYDLERGAVYKLQKAVYNATTDRWSAGGGSYYYLGSNGLHGSLDESDNASNSGHRGNPPAVHAVRWDEIQAGSIDHVLKIAVNTANRDHVWPMVGSDGDSTSPAAPPQGARLRIKPSIDLSKLGLSPPALVIARALQRYGAVVGDSSGGPAALKVENTVLEGRGWLWKGVLDAASLRAIPFSMFEVTKLGYNPGGGSIVEPTPLPSPTPIVSPTPSPSPSPSSTTFEVASAGDAFIDSSYPLANFGARDRIRARGGDVINGLVKFSLPTAGPMVRATLRLYSLGSAPGITVRAAGASWTESTVTWDWAPSVGSVVATSGPLAANKWVEIDVTSHLAAGGTASFYVTNGSTTTATFSSKEGPAELAPKLRVTTG